MAQTQEARGARRGTGAHASRRGRRGSAALAAAVVAALLAPLALVGLAAPAAAAEYRPFGSVFSTNTNGEILLSANTLMTCTTGANNCAAVRDGSSSTNLSNNDHTMRYVDVDGDASTFNSSSAELAIPAGGSVLWARLYWGGRTAAANTAGADATLRDRAVLRVPGATSYATVTAAHVDVAPDRAYQSFVDVTDLVTAAGSGSYMVGNVQSSANGTNNYAGWTLVVAVADPAAPARNLTVFDGFGSVANGDPLPDFTVDGFITPPTGDIRTSVGVVTYEGDRGLVGDQLLLNGLPLTDAENPANNAFNSTITRAGVDRAFLAGAAADGSRRNPAYRNQLGFDADVFTVGSDYIPNGATSARFRLTTGGEQFFPGVVTFSTELYDPTLLGHKSVTDLNGGDVRRGDVLEYSVPVSNIGLDVASDSRFFDAIPTGTTYVPGSLQVDGQPLTDAEGDDDGYYAQDPSGHVVVHLGTGADASRGGDIPITVGSDPAHVVTFRVRVDDAAPAGVELVNAAAMTYRGHTTRAAASSATNVVQRPVAEPATAGQTPPVAQPYVRTFTPRSATPGLRVDVLADARDAEGGPLRTVAVTDAAGGSVTIGTDGALTYTPRADFAGRDVFTYTIEDPTGLRSTAAVQVVVVNEAPVVGDDTATSTGGPVTIAALANDSDPNGDAIAYRSVPTTTPHGTVTVDDQQRLVYTPTPGFRGTDAFDYTVEDSRGAATTGRVTVTVGNGAPVAQGETLRVNPGSSTPIALLANDSDPNGDPVRVEVVTPFTQGTATVDPATGVATYVAPANPTGPATMTYRVVDDQTPAGRSDVVTVTVTFNGAPLAGDLTADVPEGDADVVVDVAGAASDPDGDALTFAVGTAPAHGSAVVTGAGGVRYTPAAGWAGTDTFTYTATDPMGLTATGTVSVTTPNVAPTITTSGASVATDGLLAGVDVLQHASDVNVGPTDQVLRVTGATADHGAQVTVNPDGTLDVRPATGYRGTVTVTFTVSDGAGGSVDGTLVVTVANAAPRVLPDTAATDTDTAVLVDVLGNDDDANGDVLTVVPASLTVPVDAAGTPRGGVEVVDGQVRYTPPAGWAGVVTFSYDATDGLAAGTASVTVTVRNAAPVTQAAHVTTPAGVPATVDLVARTTDANLGATDQQLVVTGAAADADAQVVLTDDARGVVVTGAPGFKGDVTVTYTVSDGAGGTADGVLVVTVANAAPVVPPRGPDATPYGTPVVVDVLDGVTDANDDALTVTEVGTAVDADGTPRGTVTLVDGVVTYTPPTGWSGDVTFEFAVSDGTDTTRGTVTVTVGNGAPVVPATTVTVGNAGPSAIDVLAGASDPEGGELTVVDVEQPATGTVTVVDGRLVYTPEPGFVGTVTITFTVADPQGARTVSTVTVEVVAAAAGGTTPVAVEAVPAPAGDALAVTGAQVAGVGAAAVLVLLVGAGLVVARRRWTHAG
ncbi:Ig-like domain-containing protein [Cellulomonas sp. HD19AZ1]|uniref:Ig-like domain-containing protein n=1 Tax=Cellulomonas sp. HD19AZ1 TaxID=2559593 RepID=UPI001070F80F|nr:Ig-like domain-containing protein [Cellulomonas sp. HD19AZ1]TFH69921.1 tandem-95 repeat protein [Cellulomonas sp. HD19AZ1]